MRDSLTPQTIVAVLRRKPIANLPADGTEYVRPIFCCTGAAVSSSATYDLVVDRLRPVMFSSDSSESAKV